MSALDGIYGAEQDIARLKASLLATVSTVRSDMDKLVAALEGRSTGDAESAYAEAKAALTVAGFSVARWSAFVQWSEAQQGHHDVAMMAANDLDKEDEA